LSNSLLPQFFGVPKWFYSFSVTQHPRSMHNSGYKLQKLFFIASFSLG
jgi:hypothetical protein